MNLALHILGVLSAIIVLLTVLAQLNDCPHLPKEHTFKEAVRHHVQKFGLVLVGAGAGMVGLVSLTPNAVPLESLALTLGVALRQLTHPDSWWAFVVRGVGGEPCRR